MKVSGKTVGQLVDEIADRYYASGMDAFSADVRACLDVAKLYTDALESLGFFIDSFGKSSAPADDK